MSTHSDDSFAEQITTLLEEINLAVKWDRPSILLAIYGSEVSASQARKALEKKLTNIGQKVREVRVDKENFDIPWFLAQFEQHQDVVFFISGLRWGGGRSRTNAYQALNLRRELFVDQKIRLVIWLNSREAGDLPQHAPDFWAFRHRVVEFPEEKAHAALPKRPGLTWRDWQVNETPTDAAAKIGLREKLLANLPVDPASLFTRTDLVYTLAYLNWCLKDYERSRQYLEKGLTLSEHPSAGAIQTKFRVALGMLHHEQGDLDEAANLFQQVIDQEPHSASAWNNLGRLRRDLGQADEASRAFHQAVKQAPQFACAWNNLGISHRDAGDLVEAVKSFKKAARLDPFNAIPWVNLANTQLDAGQPDQAIRAYKKAIRLQPEYQELSLDLALIYRGLNRMKDAIHTLNQVLKINSRNVLAYAGLAACYREKGKTEAAKKQLDLAQPFLAQLKEFRRAEFEAEAGDKAEALRLLQAAIDKKQVEKAAIQANLHFSSLLKDPRFKKLIREG